MVILLCVTGGYIERHENPEEAVGHGLQYQILMHYKAKRVWDWSGAPGVL